MDPGQERDARLVTRLRAAGCVYAEEEAALLREAADDGADLTALLARRLAGEPLEQVLGWAAFAGLRVPVAPGVFVPRARSALLVRLALVDLPTAAVVVDLGCGTGALAAAVLAARPDVAVRAVDVDPAAVACARRTLPPDLVGQGDLFSALPEALRGRVDVVLANAPYVPTDAVAAMPTEARDHEHHVALDGGPDGLDVQRRIVADAPWWLVDGGRLLLETGRHQAPATAALMAAEGLRARIETDDDLEATAVVGAAVGGGRVGGGLSVPGRLSARAAPR